MSDPNGVTRRKLETIRAIQDLGYRIVILRAGGVEVWVKGAPDRVFRFSGLSQALSALRAVEGVA